MSMPSCRRRPRPRRSSVKTAGSRYSWEWKHLAGELAGEASATEACCGGRWRPGRGGRCAVPVALVVTAQPLGCPESPGPGQRLAPRSPRRPERDPRAAGRASSANALEVLRTSSWDGPTDPRGTEPAMSDIVPGPVRQPTGLPDGRLRPGGPDGAFRRTAVCRNAHAPSPTSLGSADRSGWHVTSGWVRDGRASSSPRAPRGDRSP